MQDKKRIPMKDRGVYVYVRDGIITALITFLLIRALSIGEKVAIIDTKVTDHVEWGTREGGEINGELKEMKEEIHNLEIAVYGRNKN
jgi:hypothetical protein